MFSDVMIVLVLVPLPFCARILFEIGKKHFSAPYLVCIWGAFVYGERSRLC